MLNCCSPALFELFIVLVRALQVLFAFMVGLHNLYWYYGTQVYPITDEKGHTKLVHSTEAFQGYVVLGDVMSY